MDHYLLSLLIFIPLIAAGLLVFVPAHQSTIFKTTTVAATFLQLVLATWLYFNYQPTLTGLDTENNFQFVEKYDWITLNLGSLGQLSIDYFLGADGLNISMLWLAAIVMFIGAVSSWTINKSEKGYFALYLLLSSSVAGCFVALDFFLFYLFFEFMLLPMYFLIGIWGGIRREYASIKFFIYTLIGSILILLAMIGLYISVVDPAETAVMAGLINDKTQATPAILGMVHQLLAEGKLASSQVAHTFNLVAMTNKANFLPGSLLDLASQATLWGMPLHLVAFLALLIGFAVKLPVVPLHTWLPDAHVEAPTPVSVVLAGILLKIGSYGILRIPYAIFPEGAAHFAWLIGLFGLISILYGALNALAMHDLKKLIAYSSVSHMGFVLLGIASLTSEGVSGAIYQMFSHGIISAMLFLLVGVLYDRTHDRMIEHYRGLASVMPAYTVLTVIGFFASLGLPAFSGFVAELLVLLGAFKSQNTNGLIPHWMAIVATSGIILAAAYYLWTLQRMFFGKFWAKGGDSIRLKLTDLTTRELYLLLPLGIAALIFGIFPHLVLDKIGPSVNHFIVLLTEGLIR